MVTCIRRNVGLGPKLMKFPNKGRHVRCAEQANALQGFGHLDLVDGVFLGASGTGQSGPYYASWTRKRPSMPFAMSGISGGTIAAVTGETSSVRGRRPPTGIWRSPIGLPRAPKRSDASWPSHGAIGGLTAEQQLQPTDRPPGERDIVRTTDGAARNPLFTPQLEGFPVHRPEIDYSC